jgi:uncharacterized protein
MTSAGPIVVMAKPVGPICNLECGYCYYLAKTELFPSTERYRMRSEVLRAYVAAFIEACPGPVVHFVWHGGEPTLGGIDFYRRVVELQGEYLPKGWKCINSLQTNGTLIDEKWAVFIAEHQFDVGISIDGPAVLHDINRRDRQNRGSHARVLRGLNLLRAHGVDPDVLCTVNADTAAHPRDVYRFFLHQNVRWLQFIPVVQRTLDGSVTSNSVTPVAMGSFLNTIFDEWIRYDVNQITVQSFLECLFIASGEPATLCVMSEQCGQVLAVEHDGGIYSCDHFVDANHHLGNIMEGGFKGILESTAQSSFGAAKSHELPAVCTSCPVLTYCRGGCPKDRFITSESGESGLNYLCGGYRAFFEHIAPYVERMATLLKVARAPSTIMVELEVVERDERRAFRLAGRNDLCPCGSRKKFKQCCIELVRR